MKTRCFLYFFMFLILSCNKREETLIFDKERIESFTEAAEIEVTDDKKLGLFFRDFSDKFVLLKSEKIAVTYMHNLHVIYQDKFQNQYKSFDDFLFEVLNFRLKIDDKSIDQYIFNLSHKIMKEYEENKLSSILEKHCESISDKTFVVNNSLPVDEKYTILYCAYINLYSVGVEDYDGNFVIYKKEEN